MASHPPHRHTDPSRSRHAIAAVIAIAAAYTYFILFVEVTLLEGFASYVGKTALEAFVALGGISGSLFAAHAYRMERTSVQLARGFIACLLSALFCFFLHNRILASLCSFAASASIGWTSVVLVLGLRPTVHLKRLGVCCGLGIGFAYVLSSQPGLLLSTRQIQSVVVMALCAAGALCALKFTGAPGKSSASLEYRWPAISIWLFVFLGLTWINTTASSMILRSPLLRPETWDGALALQGNAFVHLCAAVLAGLALNRHQQSATVAAALVLFLVACLLLNASAKFFPAAHVFYTAGASAYVAALIYYPARSGRPRLAGVFFAATGWLGLAAGRAMSQAFHSIPTAFAVLLVALAMGALIARYYWARFVRSNSGLGNPEVN